MNGEPGYVVAMVILVRWKPKSNNGHHFGYKDMSEKVGPYEAKCPVNILRLLYPTTNEYALRRRRRCLTRLNKRSRKIVDGKRVMMPSPITFTDGFSADEFIVVKRGNHHLPARRPLRPIPNPQFS